jgi:hypothetical protein
VDTNQTSDGKCGTDDRADAGAEQLKETLHDDRRDGLWHGRFLSDAMSWLMIL